MKKKIKITRKQQLLSSLIIIVDSNPKFHHYFPETNETRAILVIERLGRTLEVIYDDLRPFSSIIVMKIGLNIVSMNSTSNLFKIYTIIFCSWMYQNICTAMDLSIMMYTRVTLLLATQIIQEFICLVFRCKYNFRKYLR